VKIPENLQVETPHSSGALARVLSVMPGADLATEHVCRLRNLFLMERLGLRFGHALEERRCARGLG
jgi:hypothetical protein